MESAGRLATEKLEWLKEHLAYEWGLLHHAYGRMLEASPTSRDWPCFFECFALHARNLYEFLTSEPDPRNFRASDFVKGRAAKKTDLTKGVFQKIDAQLMHMSKRRPSVPAGKFNTADAAGLISWLRKEMAGFVAELPAPMQAVCWHLPNPAVMIGPDSNTTNPHVETTLVSTPSLGKR